MTGRLIEVCVEDAAGIAAAVDGGADRIELCAALSLGGLTPPASLIRVAAAGALPMHLLARPREGGFVYGAAERAMIADDIRAAAEAGLAGVVIGASRPDRRLDTATLAAWIAHARDLGTRRGMPLSLTLHRAFDLCPDLPAALEEAVALGFDRVLTSGGTPRAVDGLDTLAALHRRADGRIVVLAGSGVDPDTLPAILSTGIGEVHASCRTPSPLVGDGVDQRFGFAAALHRSTDVHLVARMADVVHRDVSLEHDQYIT